MKNQRRIKLAIHRSLRARAKGGQHYDRARKEIEKIRALGLQPGEPIELEVANEKTGTIETRKFILVDNFEGAEVVYRNTGINRWDLKQLPKNPRTATKPDPTEETAQ